MHRSLHLDMPLEVEWDAAKYDSGEGYKGLDGIMMMVATKWLWRMRDMRVERRLLCPLHDVTSFPQPMRKFEEQAGTCNSAVECQSILN